MPNYREYHESITSELNAVKNRIRNLVTTTPHWLTDGEWKEAALRTVLRRHLPASAMVGRGFIVGRDDSSRQIDLLVLRPEKPTLFRDGEFAIVTPDVPGAIAEVKTSVAGQVNWGEAANTLAQHGRRCREVARNQPWLGIFAYEGTPGQKDNILETLCRVYRETGVAINCVACGPDLFVRYWPIGEYEPGDNSEADSQREYWRAYDLSQLSPSYFIGNLIDAICNVDQSESSYAWFSYPGGKSEKRLDEKRAEECLPS